MWEYTDTTRGERKERVKYIKSGGPGPPEITQWFNQTNSAGPTPGAARPDPAYRSSSWHYCDW